MRKECHVRACADQPSVMVVTKAAVMTRARQDEFLWVYLLMV